jgi:hypothetical protein
LRSRPPIYGVGDIISLCGKDEIPLNAAFLTAVAGPRYHLSRHQMNPAGEAREDRPTVVSVATRMAALKQFSWLLNQRK